MSNKNDRWSALSMSERADLMNMYITNGVSDIKEMKKHYNSFSGEEPIYGGELEAAVVKPNPVNAVLRTYYPIISEYPATGHSELQFFENHPTRPEIPVYLNRPITRGGSNYDYNLITNNCSDATRCAVENITKKKINPFLFTTPGDVKDFVIDNIEGSYNTPMKDGVISTYFQVPFADAMDAMNNQLDYEIENVKNNNKIPKKRKEEIIKGIENKKYVFQPFKYSNGGRILSGEENHPIEVKQGLQNGTIKAIKKDDGTYAYIRQEKPIEDLTQSIAEWTAAGDLMDAAVAIDAARKGDLKQAALLAGLAVVPNTLENTVKLGRRVITHNLHPDKLNAILKGKWDKKMANPSMAIRNIEDITTQEYGPITFLGKPEMLDDSFIFRGDGETSMVSALGLNDVPDVEEVSKIMREYDAKQHSFAYNEPLTKEEVLSNVDLTPSWMGYMEAKRSVPTSPKDFERAFIFTGDYKYDPQIQETLELFRSEGIPYTIYGGRGESLPQTVEGYINRNNPNLLFNNGGKL